MIKDLEIIKLVIELVIFIASGVGLYFKLANKISILEERVLSNLALINELKNKDNLSETKHYFETEIKRHRQLGEQRLGYTEENLARIEKTLENMAKLLTENTILINILTEKIKK